jgi:hypothetical protein
MRKTRALQGILVSSLLLMAGYATAFLPGGTPDWGVWLFLVGTSLIMICTMALGAAKRDGAPSLRGLFGFLFFLLVGGFGAALLLPAAEGPGSTLLLGLPLRAAIIVYGVGILPVILVPIFYAWTFPALGIRQGDVAKIREAAEAARRSTGTE